MNAAPATLGAPPSGTVSFLFTDIQGSTAAWERAPTVMPGLLARHDTLVRAAIERHGGHVFATGGDGFAAAFAGAGRAVAAAVDAQRALRSEPWPAELPIRSRMAINTGEADERDGDYFGPAVNRTARLMAIANGGQVVLSERAAAVVGQFPDGAITEPRGHHLLKDLRRPEVVHELVIDGEPGLPLRTAPTASDGLPEIRTSFVGRQRELSALTRLAADHRLVTVVGTGGAGKTRLAIEHAAEVVGGLADGAWFVDLSTAGTDDVKNRLLAALGLPASGDWGALRGWNAHLVIDNCEHVVDAAAEMVDDLLAECPGIRIVATSREALALPGEQTLPLGPMPVATTDPPSAPGQAGGGPGSDAIRLFVDRARSIDPHFDPSPAELERITDVCIALDGLPLAIELAASRIATSGIAQVVSDLLGPSSRRDRRRVDRHRSLRSTIQWSVDLMDEPTRSVFGRLAVFEDGFTIDAAVHVASDASIDAGRVRAIVTTLAEQSMLQTGRTPAGPRFSMLETVRAFAFEMLGDEQAEIRRRHLAWITEWSRRHVFDVDVPGWLSPTSEVGNQHAALRFALESADGRAAVDVFAHSAWALIGAGRFDVIRSVMPELRQLPAVAEPETAEQLALAEMLVAEAFGDFETSHSIAERFCRADHELRWRIGCALRVHHLAATAPADANRALGEFEARIGATAMSAYLRAEIAFGGADLAAAAEALFVALGVDDLVGVERRLRGRLDGDPILVGDLAVALHLLGRSDEAVAAAELLADLPGPRFTALYVPLLRAVTGCRTAPLDELVADLRAVARFERRWEPPLVVFDCVVLAALVAAERGAAVAAAEALGVTKRMPQRSLSGFAVRRVLRNRLVAELGADGWTAARERGATRQPRAALDHLIDTLAA
ncbi:MAG TPA: adenylate/guanylate cyclase domain-containing protein [Ilumatobacter sp.]